MAITYIDHTIFTRLKESGMLPPRPSILELGEAQWFGDVPTEVLSENIENLVHDEELREQLHQRMADILCGDSPDRDWDLAKLFYKVFLNYSKLTAIDFHGTAIARKIDLNQAVDLGEQFDFVFNTGTAEHVFNVFQFFKTTHEVTRPGGLMLHTMPFRGWLEHGFYSFNPTFFWDLAAVNGYTMLTLAYTELSPPRLVHLTHREQINEMESQGQLGENANLYAVMKKSGAESAFRVPMQTRYEQFVRVTGVTEALKN